jgi:DNA polymerase-1
MVTKISFARGTAARINALLKEKKWEKDVHLLLQVHDELVYEIQEGKKDMIIPEIKKIMEHVLTPEATQGIPLIVEAKVGKNWGEMETYALHSSRN